MSMGWVSMVKGFIAMDKEFSEGHNEYGYYTRQAMLYGYEADQALKYGEGQAEKIREQGRAVRSQAMVDLVDAGVVPTTGTGQLLMDEIVKNSESDAMAAALQGRQAAISLRYNQKMARLARKYTAVNHFWSGINAFFSQVASSMGGQAAGGAGGASGGSGAGAGGGG